MSRELLLLLTLLWPLLLAASLAFTRTRGLARHLTPIAALPAMLLAVSIDSSSVELPWILLGGLVHLDVTGRMFLLLAGTLSLAAGILARKQLADREGGTRLSRLLSLATSGLLWLTLAGDALLFFTAATVLGYSLYALLAAGAAKASRVFLVLLVSGDLVVFELLLVLAHHAGGTTFASIRHGLLLSAYPAEVFVLLLIGFGIKLGLIGFHFWLPPVFVQAAAPVRLLLLGFVLGVGLLGWLRLLPLGEVQWSEAGTVLQGMSLITLGYAIVVGMMQRQRYSVLAYGLITLGALFLWLLGATLAEPTLWPELFGPLQMALLQASFAFSTLFLLPRIESDKTVWLRQGLYFAGWLATLLLVTMPLGIIAALSLVDPLIASRFTWLGVLFALLPILSLRTQSNAAITAERLGAVGLLGISGMVTASYYLLTVAADAIWLPALAILTMAAFGWLIGKTMMKWLPPLPPGDIVGPVERVSVAFARTFYRWGDNQAVSLYHSAVQWLLRLSNRVSWQREIWRMEELLGRWTIAMIILLLFGLTVSWWGTA